jgi:nucleotide-binding universal stress UspA family protein
MHTQILVPVDGSPCSDLALAQAIRLAGRDGALLLMHVVNLSSLGLPPGWAAGASVDAAERLKESGEQTLERARVLARDGGCRVEALLVGGDGRVCDEVVKTAVERGADLIVLGAHGVRGVHSRALGSDAEDVLRRSPVPVLLVRSPVPDLVITHPA